MATCHTCKKRVIKANPADDSKIEVELVRVDGPVFRLKAFKPMGGLTQSFSNMAYDNTSQTYEYHQCPTTNEDAGLAAPSSGYVKGPKALGDPA